MPGLIPEGGKEVDKLPKYFSFIFKRPPAYLNDILNGQVGAQNINKKYLGSLSTPPAILAPDFTSPP